MGRGTRGEKEVKGVRILTLVIRGPGYDYHSHKVKEISLIQLKYIVTRYFVGKGMEVKGVRIVCLFIRGPGYIYHFHKVKEILLIQLRYIIT